MADQHAERIQAAISTFTQANQTLLSMLDAASDAEKAPQEGAWSPAQIAWHVAETNVLTAGIMAGKLPGSRPSPGFTEDPEVFSRIPAKVVNSMPSLAPPAQVSKHDAAQKLRASETMMIQAIESITAERGGTHTVKFPFGIVNLYQVAEFVGAHVNRHVAQMKRTVSSV